MVNFIFLMVKKGQLKGSLEPDLSFAQQTFEIEYCKWEACFWKAHLDVLVSLFLSVCYIIFCYFFLMCFFFCPFFSPCVLAMFFPSGVQCHFDIFFFFLFVNLIHFFINICLLEWLC
jgi:hypothetical protein